jgi:hypothetical protein
MIMTSLVAALTFSAVKGDLNCPWTVNASATGQAYQAENTGAFAPTSGDNCVGNRLVLDAKSPLPNVPQKQFLVQFVEKNWPYLPVVETSATFRTLISNVNAGPVTFATITSLDLRVPFNQAAPAYRQNVDESPDGRLRMTIDGTRINFDYSGSSGSGSRHDWFYQSDIVNGQVSLDTKVMFAPSLPGILYVLVCARSGQGTCIGHTMSMGFGALAPELALGSAVPPTPGLRVRYCPVMDDSQVVPTGNCIVGAP